MTQPVQEFAN